MNVFGVRGYELTIYIYQYFPFCCHVFVGFRHAKKRHDEVMRTRKNNTSTENWEKEYSACTVWQSQFTKDGMASNGMAWYAYL